MQRNKALDAVKGFAILLVMLGHCIVLNGLNASDPFVYDVIKSVQMPLFMLVSGVLASGGVRKNGSGSGMKKLPKRAQTYLLPFFSWFVLVHLYTHIKTGALSMSGFLKELKELLFQTDRGLWFLMTLFVATLCVMIAQTLTDQWTKKKTCAGWKKAIVFTSISLCFYALFFLQGRSSNTFLSPHLMLHYFPFYLIGYVGNGYGVPFLESKASGVKMRQNLQMTERILVSVFAVIFVAMAAGLDLSAPVESFSVLLLQMTASFFGTVSLYGIVYRLAQRYEKKTEKTSFLSFAGAYTLEIYVIHFRFARLLGLSEKNLQFYSPEGLGWILAAFALMALLTAITVWIIRRIPVVSYLLFGKNHVKLCRSKFSPES